MTVYAVITLEDEAQKSECQKGTSVKFRFASFAFRTSSDDHLIELQIFAQNMLVQDTLIGGAILKIEGGVNG